MKLLKIITASLFGILLVLACDKAADSSNKKDKKEQQLVEADLMPLMKTYGGYASLESIRNAARTTIDTRIAKDGDPLSMITSNYWGINVVLNASKRTKPGDHEGYWIKYNDDFTYQYGYYGKILGTGRYHYYLSNDQLVMLDDDEDKEPKFWDFRTNGMDTYVLIGRHDFKMNNGDQVQLLPLDGQPTK